MNKYWLWILLTIFVFGIGLVGVGYALSVKTGVLIENGVVGESTVVHKWAHYDRNTYSYSVEVSLAEAPDAKLLEKTSKEIYEKVSAGSKLTVTYLPDNPKVFLIGDRAELAEVHQRSVLARQWGIAILVLGGLAVSGLLILKFRGG